MVDETIEYYVSDSDLQQRIANYGIKDVIQVKHENESLNGRENFNELIALQINKLSQEKELMRFFQQEMVKQRELAFLMLTMAEVKEKQQAIIHNNEQMDSERLRDKIDKNNARIEAYNEVIKHLEAEIDKIDKKIAKLDDKLAAVSQQLAQVQQQQLTLQQAMQQHGFKNLQTVQPQTIHNKMVQLQQQLNQLPAGAQ